MRHTPRGVLGPPECERYTGVRSALAGAVSVHCYLWRMPVHVSVINDFDVVVAGVRALLAPFSDRVLVVDTQLQDTPDVTVDVALYDTFAASLDWQSRLAALAADPDVGAVAVYSFMTEPRAVEDSLAAGAAGFLAKSRTAAELVEGIELIAGGHRVVDRGGCGSALPGDATAGDRWPAEDVGLTPREAEMLSLIVRGFSNEEIARSRYLSPNTVKSYIREAYRKIGVTTRAQAVAWGMRNGLEADR